MDRALLLMTGKGFGCLGAVGADGRLVGVLTDGDLRRAMGPDLLGRSVGDVMNPAPRTIGADALGRRGAARHERGAAARHEPVRGRRRRAGPRASCTCTTCCGRASL